LAKDPGYIDVLETWSRDENLWVRRVSLVAPVYLRRAKYEEPLASELDQRTLQICERLLPDDEKYIRKAVDWSIRAVIARHYKIAREWMFNQLEKKLPRHAYSTLKLAAKKLEPKDQKAFLQRIESNSK
jgi:3-methyladenine DNA glycosylase AlkD